MVAEATNPDQWSRGLHPIPSEDEISLASPSSFDIELIEPGLFQLTVHSPEGPNGESFSNVHFIQIDSADPHTVFQQVYNAYMVIVNS